MIAADSRRETAVTAVSSCRREARQPSFFQRIGGTIAPSMFAGTSAFRTAQLMPQQHELFMNTGVMQVGNFSKLIGFDR